MRNFTFVFRVVGALLLVVSPLGRADTETLLLTDLTSVTRALESIVVVVDDDATRAALGSEQQLARAMVFLPLVLERKNVHPKVIAYDTGPNDPGALAQVFPFWKDSATPIVAGIPAKLTLEQKRKLDASLPASVSYGYALTTNLLYYLPGLEDSAKKPLPPWQVLSSRMPLDENDPILSLEVFEKGRGKKIDLGAYRFLELDDVSEQGIRKISFQQLASGAVPYEALDGKYVLIGTDQQLADAFVNRRREQVNGVFFHALALAKLVTDFGD